MQFYDFESESEQPNKMQLVAERELNVIKKVDKKLKQKGEVNGKAEGKS